MPRAFAPLAILLVALLAVWWLWAVSPPPPAAPPLAAPSPLAPSPTAPAAQAEDERSRIYRLAGVAVGTVSYAAIELPDGSSNLYRQGAEILGLGTLSEVHTDHVVIASADGPMVLQLKPAPSPTSDPRRLGPAARRTVIRPQAQAADPDDTAFESEREDDRDRPAF
ncbi:MAG TPA: type II secretion system protein N [Terriglobales bacterium]|nr:type II secretion system protein N [Terriglobales bacterium]